MNFTRYNFKVHYEIFFSIFCYLNFPYITFKRSTFPPLYIHSITLVTCYFADNMLNQRRSSTFLNECIFIANQFKETMYNADSAKQKNVEYCA